jgi:hypothetical protein
MPVMISRSGRWPMAHDALLARLGLEIAMLCEKLRNLRFDGRSISLPR